MENEMTMNTNGHTHSALLSALEAEGKTLTENGCATHVTSSSPLIDLFFKIAAMRSASEEDIISVFTPAFHYDTEAALKILFWARDIRGGQGERKVFRTIVSHLAHNHSDILRPCVRLLPVYGRWDDVLSLFQTPLEGAALEFIDDALTGKLSSSEASLCAKWMPREKSAKSVLAKKIRSHMGVSSVAYRKLLSSLSKTVESDMCSGNWDGIEYSHVPSVAMNLYKKAFARHSPERWDSYLSDLTSGSAKVNASVLYPYQVIKSLMNYGPEEDEKLIAEKQWEALPNYLMNNPYRILPVVDVSGSMSGSPFRTTGPAPMDVSVSLGIYIAERNNGPFKDHFLTFSGAPTLQRLKGENLFDKVQHLKRADWGMNTDIEATFNLILSQAMSNNIMEEDMPNMILILSDMEFDAAASGTYTSTAMDSIRDKYAEAGYKLPNIVFWNLAARGSNIPVKFDELGTALVSGFSPSILVQILSAGEITPEAIMNEVLDSERYSAISKQS
tara:strand:- start:606 stop:2111 length:1506 start_codon:yes stop_codon:yes gene_type:complete